jgi:hypothetical protein
LRNFAVLALLAVASPAFAAGASEQAYLAARDRAVATLKHMTGNKQDAAERRLRAGLEAQLKSVINPPPLKDFPGSGTISPESLIQTDIGADGLDGLVFRNGDENTVLVTTDGLLKAWLKAHKTYWKDLPNPPVEPEAAFHSEAFYTQAASPDAAVSIFATLPIRKPDGATLAAALLVQEAQDIAVEPPEQIAVAVAKGGRVFIAIVKAAAKPAPIAACEAVWKDSQARSEAAAKAYRQDAPKSADESTRLENEGAEAFHKCWSEKASTIPTFPALTQQAQSLADLFAAQ